MKTELIAINKVKKHPKNSRLHDERNILSIMESVEAFGQNKPVVVNAKNVILAGHGLHEAIKRSGKKRIHIYRVLHLTPDEELAYVIADNKTGDLSQFDFEMLASQMQELEGAGINLSSTGFAEHEIEPLMQAEFQPEKVGSASRFAEEEYGKEDSKFSLSFTEDEFLIVNAAIARVNEFEGFENHTPAQALTTICEEYIDE